MASKIMANAGYTPDWISERVPLLEARRDALERLEGGGLSTEERASSCPSSSSMCDGRIRSASGLEMPRTGATSLPTPPAGACRACLAGGGAGVSLGIDRFPEVVGMMDAKADGVAADGAAVDGAAGAAAGCSGADEK